MRCAGAWRRGCAVVALTSFDLIADSTYAEATVGATDVDSRRLE